MWRTVNHEVRANAPLPPAQIELVNSHSAARADLDRRPTGSAGLGEVRIEPNSRVLATFDRDAGATVVETYELRSPSGVWDRQQFVTQIPPTPIYDLSVYEEFLQSIAIDRTGTSPNQLKMSTINQEYRLAAVATWQCTSSPRTNRCLSRRQSCQQSGRCASL